MIQALEQQRQLLRMEYEYEKELFRRHTETTSIVSKIKRGDCWFPLHVNRSYYNSLDQLVIEVWRTESLDEEHNFEPGKPVSFFTQEASLSRHGDGGMVHFMRFAAQVNFVEDNRMVITLPNKDALLQVQNADRLGILLALDESTYQLMFEALENVIAAKGNRLADLRDIFHTQAPLSKFTFMPTRFPWLNSSQEQAVNEVLWAKDVAVVHGPPGTGKTTTLVEAIYETLHRETQVMVSAQSNMAVDWIAEKLSDRGVSVLRIGNPTRVTDRMLEFTYEHRFESHPLYSQLWAIRKAIRDLYASKKKGDGFQQKISRLKDRATELELGIRQNIFDDARVIACTLTGSANRLLTGCRFGTLFIDEAAQALEAACWIAITKANRVILAGDHRQLPPTLKCPEALRGGLDHTLMQTIVENKPQCVSLLRVQYRMCDGIMQFPNKMFYEGMLESDPSVKYRGILDWDTPIEWFDTPCEPEFVEIQAGDGLSRQNPAEADLTLHVLQDYFEKIGKERILYERIDVGLISPYRGQVQLLRKKLRHNAFFKPFRHLITINTVDGFQGQERDVIVISMVRSNEEGQVGFLRDLRRMNVAITRARMKLMLIGHKETLCKHPFYQKLNTYIEENPI